MVLRRTEALAVIYENLEDPDIIWATRLMDSPTICEQSNAMRPNRQIAKWGFGMAPISSRMRRRYDHAVQTTLDLLYGNPAEPQIIVEALSELKGMFNRCVRKDQWDYAMVQEELGAPTNAESRRIVSHLINMRRALLAQDQETVDDARRRLENSNILLYLENYQDGIAAQIGGEDVGWIYVLSTRETPNILKIGMTSRSVSLRVKEINSATGVIYPFGARYVFRVNNAKQAEEAIHQDLNGYRIRSDREFFDIPPGDAIRLIEQCLDRFRLRFRTKGAIVWFDHAKHYGFVSASRQQDVFVHGSEVERDDVPMLTPGTDVEFELNRSGKGLYATRLAVVRAASAAAH